LGYHGITLARSEIGRNFHRKDLATGYGRQHRADRSPDNTPQTHELKEERKGAKAKDIERLTL